MISLYVHGDSVLHRLPAGLKMLLLAVWALTLTLVPTTVWIALAAVAVPLVCYPVLAGVRRGLRLLVADVRGLWLLYVVLFLFQWLFMGIEHAVLVTARVLGVVLAAQVLTRTTRIGDLSAVVERVIAPLNRVPVLGSWLWRIGVRPERVGLAMGLVLSAVGHLGSLSAQIRQAQASRGVRMAPWAWVLPLLVLSLKHADDVGDALVARGIE